MDARGEKNIYKFSHIWSIDVFRHFFPVFDTGMSVSAVSWKNYNYILWEESWFLEHLLLPIFVTYLFTLWKNFKLHQKADFEEREESDENKQRKVRQRERNLNSMKVVSFILQLHGAVFAHRVNDSVLALQVKFCCTI